MDKKQTKKKKDFRISMDIEMFNSLTKLAKIFGISRNQLALHQLEKIYTNKTIKDVEIDIQNRNEILDVLRQIKVELNKSGVLINQCLKTYNTTPTYWRTTEELEKAYKNVIDSYTEIVCKFTDINKSIKKR